MPQLDIVMFISTWVNIVFFLLCGFLFYLFIILPRLGSVLKTRIKVKSMASKRGEGIILLYYYFKCPECMMYYLETGEVMMTREALLEAGRREHERYCQLLFKQYEAAVSITKNPELSKNFKDLNYIIQQDELQQKVIEGPSWATELLKYQPQPGQIGFNQPATPSMLGIIDLHHTIMFYLIFVFCIVTFLLIAVIILFWNNKNIANFSHCPILEIVWTIVPSFIIAMILFPSLGLLYMIEDFESYEPVLTVKIIGHQWYWSYEFSGQTPDIRKSVIFDSNLINDSVKPDYYEVDNPLYLPTGVTIRLLMTSEDVIHSWAIPAFGIKMDAIPGRLNQVFTIIVKEGIYYGQCSELCGLGHGFMPIKIIAIPELDFINNNY